MSNWVVSLVPVALGAKAAVTTSPMPVTIGVGGGGHQSSGLDAAFAFDGIETNQVEGNVPKHSQVMSGVAGTGTHLIVGEDDIQAPMQAVLDSPV